MTLGESINKTFKQAVCAWQSRSNCTNDLNSAQKSIRAQLVTTSFFDLSSNMVLWIQFLFLFCILVWPATDNTHITELETKATKTGYIYSFECHLPIYNCNEFHFLLVGWNTRRQSYNSEKWTVLFYKRYEYYVRIRPYNYRCLVYFVSFYIWHFICRCIG